MVFVCLAGWFGCGISLRISTCFECGGIVVGFGLVAGCLCCLTCVCLFVVVCILWFLIFRFPGVLCLGTA